MAGEWATVSLGELCEFRAGTVFKPALQGRTSGEFPFVKVSDMNLPANAVRIQAANNWVSAEDLDELRAKPLPPGAVVFAKIGEALRQNRLRQVARATIVDNNMMGAVPRLDRIDPRYFYYALSQFDFSEIAQGTALPYLTVASLSALTLELPALREQRGIAHILGTLDDKIDLNRRMNETLEAMARAIFKSWFVDFDPVRAKGEGRDPGLPKPLADFFPDSFEDSELGEIPKGWRVGKISDLAILSRDGVTPGDFPDEVFDHYSIPAFDEGRTPTQETGEAIKSNKFIVPADCVLLSKLNPRLPRVWLPDVQSARRSVCSTEYLIAVPRLGVPLEFLYCLLSSDAFLSEFATLVTGTSGSHQRVKPESLLQIDAVIGPESIVQRFASLVTPLLERFRSTVADSRTLAGLRDTLLPKLISGELRVPDAERFLKETARC